MKKFTWIVATAVLLCTFLMAFTLKSSNTVSPIKKVPREVIIDFSFPVPGSHSCTISVHIVYYTLAESGCAWTTIQCGSGRPFTEKACFEKNPNVLYARQVDESTLSYEADGPDRLYVAQQSWYQAWVNELNSALATIED